MMFIKYIYINFNNSKNENSDGWIQALSSTVKQ